MTSTLGLTGEARDQKIAASFQSWLGRHSARKRTRLAAAAEALVEGTSLVADLAASPPSRTAPSAGSPRRCSRSTASDPTSATAARPSRGPARVHARAGPGLHPLGPVGGDRAGPGPARRLAAPGGDGGGGAGLMARFLFVVPPLTGHVNPTMSVARELEARGHEVAWAGHPGAVRRLLPDGARILAMAEDEPDGVADQVVERARGVRGAAALKFLWEDFLVPLARSMRPGVEAAIDAFAPDVVAVDQQAVAGALACRRRGLPWATMATTSAGVTDPLAGLPQVKRWLADLLGDLARDAEVDLDGAPGDEVCLSPHRVVVFSTEALVGPTDRFGANYRFVGPSIHDRPGPRPFPLDSLGPGTHVLVSLGTVNAGSAAASSGPRLMPTPRRRPGVLPRRPAPPRSRPASNVARWVPQLALLEQVDAVVSHAGHNTVAETLAHAGPLVVAPIRDDQPVVANQVVAAGAGVRVRFARVGAPAPRGRPAGPRRALPRRRRAGARLVRGRRRRPRARPRWRS